ncbi:hypothetical protein FQA39_LY01771 [Lamprigera yunnana]|nr:hypothetical protein FQA39_LY01771 [Lamprigera yunnana]
MFNIEGKIALVTGGAEGIGKALAKELLKNGAKGVTIVDAHKEAATETLEEISNEFGKEKVIFAEVDVSNKYHFEGAFKKTIEKFSNIDIVVNSAGLSNEVDWERMVGVNVNGMISGNMLAFENYIPKYKSGPEGMIINISSIACTFVGGFHPIYTATKHAAVGISRSLGHNAHYKRTKVKVILVCPGVSEFNGGNIPDDVFLNTEYVKLWKRFQKDKVIQTTSHVAENIIKIMKAAETGSVWIVEDNENPYEIDFPSRQELHKRTIS